MPDHKYKGASGHNPRQGLGRLRRANSKDTTRVGGWEQRHEDDEFLERHGHLGRRSHSGENLLARFNRLAAGGGQAEAHGASAEICGFAGNQVLIRTSDGTEISCQVRQLLKKRISGVKNPLCVGDRVRYQLTDEGGVINHVEPRRNQLARTDSHNHSLMHVFAANLDLLVIVAALVEPDLKYGLIDRYLLIAAQNSIPATLVLNKGDLADGAMPLALYRSLEVPSFVISARHGSGDIAALRTHLAGKTCVVAGQSGVGKSSLLNALFPEFSVRVGAVAAEGFGRHTTTSARSYPLPGGGRLIDTPGIRECGIHGLTALDVALLYTDLARHRSQCRFVDCTHLCEPDCAVRTAVERGEIAASRYESYRSIISEDLATG